MTTWQVYKFNIVLNSSTFGIYTNSHNSLENATIYLQTIGSILNIWKNYVGSINTKG